MTLDDAIKHAEEVAYQKDLESGFDTDNERYAMTDNERADCETCADEHRQLAEWLKDYKRLLEQQPSDDKITITMNKGTLKYSGHGYVVYNKDWFRKHFATEVRIMTGYDGYIEQQPNDETIKYLECNDIDVQEFIKAMKSQPLQAIQPPTCEDCVSRAEVFEIMGNLMSIPYDFDRQITEKDVSESMDEIKALPPVTPTRKVGKWIEVLGGCKCPFCDMAFSRLKEDCSDNYCPNCGAEMRGAENG